MCFSSSALSFKHLHSSNLADLSKLFLPVSILFFSLSQSLLLNRHPSFGQTSDLFQIIDRYLFGKIIKALHKRPESVHMDTPSRSVLSLRRRLARYAVTTLHGPIQFCISTALQTWADFLTRTQSLMLYGLIVIRRSKIHLSAGLDCIESTSIIGNSQFKSWWTSSKLKAKCSTNFMPGDKRRSGEAASIFL